jgi:hypothetical protein
MDSKTLVTLIVGALIGTPALIGTGAYLSTRAEQTGASKDDIKQAVK